MATFDSPEMLKAIAEFCRSGNGVPVKQAIERMRGHHDTDRRVEYFRGEKLITTLLGDVAGDSAGSSSGIAALRPLKKKPAKKRRPFEAKDVEEATAVCAALLREGFIHRSTRTGRGQLEFAESQKWEASACYVWDFEGAKGLSHFLTGLLIVGMLAVTCFPIWPHVLKVYLWYCSVTLLIFMIVFIIIRGTLFLWLWIMGYEFWIFPNLFDESLSVIDSFKPAYSFESGAPNQRYYRSALVMALLSFVVYVYNQPSDFDTFVAAQKEFVADLYEGKLLADTSQQAKDDIDKLQRPSFEELAMEEEAEARERAAREELENMHRKALDPQDDQPEEEDEDAAAQDLIDRMLNEVSQEEEDDDDDDIQDLDD
ncbi:hypothetical protein CTAYLR_003632 [Chrysophaeum taylorii]|uniref:Translocation protein SEC62 n=1 Tax=Chrysophaeum taylorii TaxID=2483200 RepID=A0AAD7UD33_9STRA|nr:hypothetical protein CTAYLR_003632 [Chrysophaeum taylorii]